MNIFKLYNIKNITEILIYIYIKNENEYSTCTSFKLTMNEIKLAPNKPTPFVVSFIPTKVLLFLI